MCSNIHCIKLSFLLWWKKALWHQEFTFVCRREHRVLTFLRGHHLHSCTSQIQSGWAEKGRVGFETWGKSLISKADFLPRTTVTKVSPKGENGAPRCEHTMHWNCSFSAFSILMSALTPYMLVRFRSMFYMTWMWYFYIKWHISTIVLFSKPLWNVSSYFPFKIVGICWPESLSQYTSVFTGLLWPLRKWAAGVLVKVHSASVF